MGTNRAAQVDVIAEEYGQGKTMPKFKVGDRVRCVVAGVDYAIGEEFTLTGADDDGDVYFIDNAGDARMRPCSEFEPLPVAKQPAATAKFKVGDRVRLVKGSQWNNSLTQSVGTVVETAAESTAETAVIFDGDDFTWHLQFSDLIPATLTIGAGRYYKTRDGRKVGPMVKGSLDVQLYDEAKSVTSYGWYPDGSFICGAMSTIDLIAEWVEPQAEPVDSSPQKLTSTDGDTILDVANGTLTIKLDAHEDAPTVTQGRLVKTPRGYGYELARFDKWSFVDTGGSVPIVITSNKLAAA